MEEAYSTYEWGGVEDVPEEIHQAAQAAHEAEALRFHAAVTDACGTTVESERAVTIEIGWLED